MQWIQQLTVSVGSASEILDDAIARLQVLADCDYRDAEVLLADAEQRRKEYVRAEESRKQRIKDKERNQNLRLGCLSELVHLLLFVIAPIILLCIINAIGEYFFG